MVDITVEKAIAINCWDVKVNGAFLERFDRKKDAIEARDNLRSKYL